jgi:D-2-hydroxyglutarate dehydrogenase
LPSQDRYPIKRGHYAELTEKDIATFESILDKNRVLTGDDASGYNVDWMRSVRGYSNVALRPKTTEEVSEIMKFCNSKKLAVCPQGGNTGLVSDFSLKPMRL